MSAIRPANTDTKPAVQPLNAAVDFLDLAHRRQGGDIQPNALGHQMTNDLGGRVAARVGHGNLHEDVLPPLRDGARLLFHLAEVVGEDLERNGQLGNELDDVTRERLVVFDAGSSHQGRVRREARDDGIGRQLRNRVAIGAVGEDLHAQTLDHFVHCVTGSVVVRPRIHSAASSRFLTVASGSDAMGSA